MFDVFFVRGYSDSNCYFQEEFETLGEARSYFLSCDKLHYVCVLIQKDSESGCTECVCRSLEYDRKYGR